MPIIPTKQNGIISHTYVQPLIAKLPICQSAILFKSSENIAVKVVSKALTNKEKTIPANIIVLLDMVLSILLENNITK